MILGITGGVASGKSTLASILAELGAPFHVASVSADAIARELLAPGTGLTERVLLHFGDSIRLRGPDEAIDRAALGRRIFLSADDRYWLEQLLHPIIGERIHAATSHYRGQPVASPDSPYYRLAIAEIPLLYEAQLEGTVDLVAVAICPEEMQLARLRQRRLELSESDALAQVRSQMPVAEKAKRADFVIDTGGSIEQLRSEAAVLLEHLVRGRV